MEHLLSKEKIKTIVCDDDYTLCKTSIQRRSGEDNHPKKQGLETKTSKANQPRAHDPAVLIYSSGTTAKPKGVILTQKNLLAQAKAISAVTCFPASTRTLLNLPFFFIGGIAPSFFTTTYVGGSVVVQRKFSKSKFWERISTYRIQWTFLVPTMIAMLLNPPEKVLPQNKASLRYVFSSAAPLPVELAKQFEKHYHIPIYEAYGLTENTAWATLNPLSKKKRILGSVGLPLPGIKIRISKKKTMKGNKDVVGEVLIKGPIIMKQYHNLPELTKQTLKNGYLHTGDIGYCNTNGYLFLVDRKKDIIIRGGENISPMQIDNVLYEHPAVALAATIGVPDPIYGEEVVSYVVKKSGVMEDAATLEKALLDHCKTKLAASKCPKKILFVTSIPKGGSGKILRRLLREQYQQDIQQHS